MLAKIAKKRGLSSHPIPLIFIDTLYHFDETLQLAKKVEKRYKLQVKIYKPPGVENVTEFEAKYGQQLWEKDEETYDYLVKVNLLTFFFFTRPRHARRFQILTSSPLNHCV